MTENDIYCDNKQLLEMIRGGSVLAKEELIQANLGLVTGIAKRFSGRAAEFEDIVEVGKIGLIKAIDGFDETLGYSFSTYAFPMILGEIKRFLRDDGIIRVSRSIKKNSALIHRAKEEYIKKHGEEPKISELCDICNLSSEDIIEALTSCSPVVSLEDKVGTGDGDMTVADTVADVDRISEFTDSFALKQAVSSLPDFERRLIELRYYKGFTQVNTAKILGISQVSVSRAEKRIISHLKSLLLA